MDVDNPRQHSSLGSRLSIRRIALRPFRPPVHRPVRCRSHHTRYDHRVHSKGNEYRHRRTSLCRNGCWHQRAHGFGCDLGNGTRFAERQICRRTRLYHRPVLLIRPLRPTHRRIFVLEIHRPILCSLQLGWPCLDCGILFPSTSNQPRWVEQASDTKGYRLGWGLLEHLGPYSLQ